MVIITITWQRLCDLLLLFESFLGIVWALAFLTTLLQHRSCRKSPLALLVGNASLAGLLFHSVVFSQGAHMLLGYPERLCVLRGHLIHSFAGALHHSICLQALHRLFITVFANQTCLHSPKVLVLMTVVQWIFSLGFCLPTLNPYPMQSDMCLGPFHRRPVFIHLALAVYFFPTTLLIVLYTWIFYFIRSNTSVHIRQSLSIRHRLRREIRILRRIIIPPLIMILTGLPMALFFVRGQLSLRIPEYATRLGMIFLTAGAALAMLMNLIFTDSVRQHLLCQKYICALSITRSTKQRSASYLLNDALLTPLTVTTEKNITTDIVAQKLLTTKEPTFSSNF